MNYAIILAGGVGARVGADKPKQFIEVLGKPMMVYTLETFQKSSAIDKIVLVCLEPYLDLAKKYCDDYKISKVKFLVGGGDDFLSSFNNGIKALEEIIKDDDIVVITSADRPFISEEEIIDSVEVCKIKGSGVAARPCSLCMFKTEGNKEYSSQYLRNSLLQTATPWSFKYKGLAEALKKYNNGELQNCESYPIAIYSAAGNDIFFSKLLPENFKITESTDVLLMECILKQKERTDE